MGTGIKHTRSEAAARSSSTRRRRAAAACKSVSDMEMNDSLPDANLHQTDTGVTTQPILPSTARDVSGTGTRPPEPPPLHTPPLSPLPLSPHPPPSPPPTPGPGRFQVGAAAGVSPSAGDFSKTSKPAPAAGRKPQSEKWPPTEERSRPPTPCPPGTRGYYLQPRPSPPRQTTEAGLPDNLSSAGWRCGEIFFCGP